MNYTEFFLWDGKELNKDFLIRARGNEDLASHQYEVRKIEVMKRNFERATLLFGSVTGFGKWVCSKMLYYFEGWDADPRPLHEIEEVRRYVERVVAEHPHIWYHLKPELNVHILLCLVPRAEVCNPDVGPFHVPQGLPPGGRTIIRLDIPALERQLEVIKEAALAYGRSIDDEVGALSVMEQWRQALNL